LGFGPRATREHNGGAARSTCATRPAEIDQHSRELETRRVPDTFCISDTATQPLGRLPAIISTAGNVIGGAECD
jgi:hypothetical protein